MMCPHARRLYYPLPAATPGPDAPRPERSIPLTQVIAAADTHVLLLERGVALGASAEKARGRARVRGRDRVRARARTRARVTLTLSLRLALTP